MFGFTKQLVVEVFDNTTTRKNDVINLCAEGKHCRFYVADPIATTSGRWQEKTNGCDMPDENMQAKITDDEKNVGLRVALRLNSSQSSANIVTGTICPKPPIYASMSSSNKYVHVMWDSDLAKIVSHEVQYRSELRVCAWKTPYQLLPVSPEVKARFKSCL